MSRFFVNLKKDYREIDFLNEDINKRAHYRLLVQKHGKVELELADCHKNIILDFSVFGDERVDQIDNKIELQLKKIRKLQKVLQDIAEVLVDREIVTDRKDR